jgi:hypothetical protein
MEVPHALRVNRDQVGMRAPYLMLPQQRFAADLDPEGVSVGLVWQVGDWDKRRAIPGDLLRSLAVPGVTLHALQRGARKEELDRIGARDISTSEITDLGHVLNQLDLVICVDTMVAHLAGALGREAWVLLHADCDWRWPLSGDRSIWYPSLRLFHQTRPGDWTDVVADVAVALTARAELDEPG